MRRLRVASWPRMTVAGRCAYFLGLAGAGFGYKLDDQALLTAGLAIVLPVGWAMWSVRRQVLGLSVRDERPRTVRAGTRSALLVHVAAMRGVGTLEIQTDGRTARVARAVLGPLAAGSETSCSLSETHVQRGHHVTGPIILRTTRPFGFAVAEARLGGGRPQVVLPALVGVRGRRFDAATMASPRVAPRSRRRGDHPQIHRLRPYLPSDPVRSVHWKATARYGELIVREGEEEQRGKVWLGLRTGIGRSVAERQSAELAISFVATLLGRWSRAGIGVRLAIGGGGSMEIPAGSRGAVRRAEIALAGISSRVPFPEFPADPEPGFTRHVLIATGPMGTEELPEFVDVWDVDQALARGEVMRLGVAS